MAVANDRDRAAGVGVIFLGVVDAERVVERGGHIVGRDRFVEGPDAVASLSPTTWPPRTPPPAISMNMQRG